MFLLSLWHNKENKLEFFDESFQSVTDEFRLTLKGRKVCNRFNVNIDSVELCEGNVVFILQIECSIPPGEYDIEIRNINSGELVVEAAVQVYKDSEKCINCK